MTKLSTSRGSRKPRLSTSEKADRLTAMILQSKDDYDSMVSSIPRKKKKKKARDAFDMVAAGLPEKEREIIEGLVDGEEGDEEQLSSIFEKAFSTLHADAANPDADYRSDQAAKNMQRASLALVLRMIPMAEVNYRHTKKRDDAYALLAFIDQARELSNELRMLNDADGQIDFIVNKIVKPLFLNGGQILLSEMLAIKNSIDTELRGEKTSKIIKRRVDESANSLGKFWAEMQQSIASQLDNYLRGGIQLDVPASVQQKPKRKKRRRGDHD